MKDIMKKLGKGILVILIILILGIAILALRIFVIDKDYNPTYYSKSKDENNKSATDTINSNEASKLNDSESSNSTSSSSSIGKKVINGAKTLGNSTVRGYKEAEEKYDYNAFNFDEAFLMYEGEQSKGTVETVLDHLISNSEESFYDRTSITAVNFGNNVTIDYDGDVTQYQNSIRELSGKLIDGLYDISFRYGGFGTYVNEIVITKK